MSFPGPIDEIPNILVDNFEVRDKKAYFLSHGHKDHYSGLYSRNYLNEIIEKAGKIYMSEGTKIIMNYFFMDCNTDIIELMMEPLKTGMIYTIEVPDGKSFEVTLIPVTHAPGAVMFLFKTEDKTILYTGDFILDVEEIPNLKELHKNGRPLRLDALYIDSTFNCEAYKHFPSRESCFNEVVQKIEEWMNENEQNGVALFHKYPTGYEDLHKTIYERTGTKLYWGDSAVLSAYRDLYGVNSPLTDEISRIHVCRNNKQNMSHWSCNPINKVDKPGLSYLYIYASAQRGCFYEPSDSAISSISSDRDLYLCFSTHCSKTQLTAFEEYFSPLKTVRFPEFPMEQPPHKWMIICPYREKREKERMEEFGRGG